MKDIEGQIKETVKKLLDEDKIDLCIGYTCGTLPLRARPYFISDKDQTDDLIWNSSCINNLAVYLPSLFLPDPGKKEKVFPRVGILAKGCDGRSIVGLIKEGQVPRESLFIIGLGCEGMVDRKKMEEKLDGGEIVKAEETEDEISVWDDRRKKRTFKRQDMMDEACSVCQYPAPAVYDVLVGEEKQVKKEDVDPYGRLREFEAKSTLKRWEYFQDQISKCIRCYACRAACPNCYCKECFVEQTQPKWMGTTNELSELIFFHLGRIFHQAGRCLDCGACSRACPMGIDLRLFTSGLVKDAQELFGYQAGLSLEEPAPLTTFKPEDTQEFITEP